jgi:hypothetical protein
VQRRAQTIIDKIEQKAGRRVLNKTARLIENGEFDQAVERLVRWSVADRDGTHLQPLSRLAGKLLELERRKFDKTSLMLSDKYGMKDLLNAGYAFRYLSRRDPLVDAESLFSVALRAPEVTVQDSLWGFIASTGRVNNAGRGGIQFSVIFACGSVTLKGTGKHGFLVIVSDGDVEISSDSNLFCSLIVARGDVTLPRDVRQSTVLAGGQVKQERRLELRDCVVREHDLNGLGLIKFFDPKKAGIEVAADKEGVKVKAMAKDKPFAAALRSGDIVKAVGGKETPTPETFLRVFRAALAEEGRSMSFTITRSGETKKVVVPMKR